MGERNEKSKLNLKKLLMKMKFIATGLLFLSFSLLHAQNQGIATYTVSVAEDEDDPMQQQMINVFPDLFDYIDQLTFQLHFNNQASYFTLEDKMYENELIIDATALVAHYTKPQVRIEDKTYAKKEKNTYVNAGKWMVSDVNIDWEITQETKQINNYTVYKANAVYNTGATKEKYKKAKVTAWFCPEIPMPYGPLNFGNLPGLIFEVNFKNVSYGLTKIEFKPVKIPEVDFENTVTIEEDERMTKEYFGM